MAMAVSHSAAASAARLRRLRGIVFDMDGTLTVPVLDFKQIYIDVLGSEHPALRSGSHVDLLHEIHQWPAPQQTKAFQTIARYEEEARHRLQIMPGAFELCKFLDSRNMRRGIITRNVKESVDFFHSRFGLKEFHPALGREFFPYKPHPAPFLHICKSWNVPPAEVMMVGDSLKDDVVCGNRAGALTCLLDETDRYDLTGLSHEEQPHFKVKALSEVQKLIEAAIRSQENVSGLPE